MKKICSCLFVVAVGWVTIACSSTNSLSPSVLKELETTENAMFAAISNGDSATFRKLCGTDYYTINANGEAHNLAESVPYTPRFKGSVNKLSEQQQRVFGNFAVRNGRAKIYLEDRQVAEVLYTTGWVYRDERWQFVHWQGTMTGMMLEPLRGKVSMEPPPVK